MTDLMNQMTDFTAQKVFITAWTVFTALVMYWIGRGHGIKAERLRVTWLFDCALAVVSSGALNKVRRAIRGETTRQQMLGELLDEAGHRAREKRATTSGGALEYTNARGETTRFGGS